MSHTRGLACETHTHWHVKHTHRSTAVYSQVGDGAHILFRRDRWLHGRSIAHLALWLLTIPKGGQINGLLLKPSWTKSGSRMCKVHFQWMSLLNSLSYRIIYLRWNYSQGWKTLIFGDFLCGQYKAKSAYDRFFQGALRFEPYERIWKTWAPGKCCFFMWLVAHNRCWTADRLARRGLDHPTRCLHCDQDSETINHLLVDCVFAWDFWYSLLQKIGMQSLSPQQGEASFERWWARTNEAVDVWQEKAWTLSSWEHGHFGTIGTFLKKIIFLQQP